MGKLLLSLAGNFLGFWVVCFHMRIATITRARTNFHENRHFDVFVPLLHRRRTELRGQRLISGFQKGMGSERHPGFSFKQLLGNRDNTPDRSPRMAG